MKIKLLLAAIVLLSTGALSAPADTSLFITEVMFNSTSPNSQFIEIYNQNDIPLDLSRFRFKSGSNNKDTIIDAGYGTVLNPNTYAVVFENDYDLQTGIYKLPSNCLILKISDDNFGLTGLSNSSTNTLVFYDDANRMRDSITYSSIYTKDISKERIQLLYNTTIWGNSNLLNGTPGSHNSIRRYNYDLAIDTMFVANGLIGDTLLGKITIINKGFNSVNRFSYSINNVNAYYPFSISSLDTLILFFNIIPDKIGANIFTAKVNFSNDEYTENNTFTYTNIVADIIKYHDFVINEVMANPASGESEWIELYNNSTKSLNLLNLIIEDDVNYCTINNNLILPPYKYVVLTSDTNSFHDIQNKIYIKNLPIFNNDKEKISLKQTPSRIIDSVSYINASEGISLERYDSLRFYKSLSGSTPGKVNSITGLTELNFRDVIISEIQTVADSVNNEFVELFSTLSINPSRLTITSGTKEVNPLRGDDNYSLAELELNNTAGRISVYDFTGKIIDSLNYNSTFFNKLLKDYNRRSLEKIILNGVNDSTNWSSSLSKTLNTKGMPNSFESKPFDIEVVTFNDTTTVIRNNGPYDAYNVQLLMMYKEFTFFKDLKFDLKKDSLFILTYPKPQVELRSFFYVEVKSENDYNPNNNYKSKLLYPSEFVDGIKISEIMNYPLQDESEWIELFNSSKDSINLSNVYLVKNNIKYSISSVPFYLRGYNFILISKNQVSGYPTVVMNMPQLHNYVDELKLVDSDNNELDRAAYSYPMQKVGVSLERDDYSTSNVYRCHSDYSTPCLNNSVFNFKPLKPKGILISEINSVSENEAIEIYNSTEEYVSDRLYLEDGNNQRYYIYGGFSKNNYLKLNGFTVPDKEGIFIIKDYNGLVLDSVHYYSDWHNKNVKYYYKRSLERKDFNVDTNDPLNWTTSLSDGLNTLGYANSKPGDAAASAIGSEFEIKVNPFSPDNDGFQDETEFLFNFDRIVNSVNIKIFDSIGNLLTELKNEAYSSSGSITYNGLDKEGNRLPMGMYIVLIEAVDENGIFYRGKKVLVSARKM